MYVVELVRDCTKSTNLCVELADKGGEDDLIIGVTDPLLFIERMYIHPGTKSGPAVAETIMPKLIHFRQRKRKGLFNEAVREITDKDVSCDS